MDIATNLLMLIVLCFLGGVSLMLGIVLFFLAKKKMKRCTEEVNATISKKKYSRSTHYFYTVEGIKYRYKLTITSSFPIKNLTYGEVIICYDPNNPKNAYMKNKKLLSTFSILSFGFLVSGLVEIAVGIFLYYMI